MKSWLIGSSLKYKKEEGCRTASAADNQQKAADKGRKEDAERMIGICPIISPPTVYDVDDEDEDFG